MVALLDTNVIIRHLAGDHADHSPRARQVFQELQSGSRTVTLTEAVLVESVQVISSKALYNLPRPEIHRHLAGIIGLKGVRLAHKPRYLRALALYEAYPRLSFVDALLAAYAEASSPATVLSFDQGFDKVPGITRQEPE